VYKLRVPTTVNKDDDDDDDDRGLFVARPVASLGLASPGAATDGVIPILFLKKKPTTFFSHRRLQSDNLMTFSAVRPRLSTVLSKSSHKFSLFHSGVIPEGCHPGRSAVLSRPSP